MNYELIGEGKYINRDSVYVGKVKMLGKTIREDGSMPLADEDNSIFAYGWVAEQTQIDDVLTGESRVLIPSSSFRVGPYLDEQIFMETGELKVEDLPQTIWFRIPRVVLAEGSQNV